jgi:hypothetical protein
LLPNKKTVDPQFSETCLRQAQADVMSCFGSFYTRQAELVEALGIDADILFFYF